MVRNNQTDLYAAVNSTVGPSPIELINAKQLATLLSISERTLYRLKSMGELPMPVILGGSVRWRRTEISCWIEQGCPKPSRRE